MFRTKGSSSVSGNVSGNMDERGSGGVGESFQGPQEENERGRTSPERLVVTIEMETFTSASEERAL